MDESERERERARKLHSPGFGNVITSIKRGGGGAVRITLQDIVLDEHTRTRTHVHVATRHVTHRYTHYDVVSWQLVLHSSRSHS